MCIRFYPLSVLLTLFSINLHAQTGTLVGKISDSKTSEALIGATILINGSTMGASTDLDGKYQIANVPVGTFDVTIRYISYKTKVINNIKMEGGEVKTLNVALEENTTDLKEIIIESTYNRESASVQLMEQKNAVVVSDGISADIIRKTPDNTASDVMKRVTGAAIQDNRFAVVRGLNDRYNSAFINGAPLPSTESDRRAFSFDLFPSNMLDGLVIIKSATPDLPADFAGGLIQVNTKDVPDEDFFTVQVGAGMHSITTFKKQLYYEGGKTDWLGRDDGTRAIPPAIPSSAEFKGLLNSDPQKLNLSREFANNWQVLNRNAPLNNNAQISGGKNWKFNKHHFGFIGSVSRNASQRYSQVLRNFYNVPDDNMWLYSYNDSLYKEEIITGILLNMSYRIGDRNRISFKNALILNSEDQTVRRRGLNNLDVPGSEQELNNTALWYVQSQLLSNQLAGDHVSRNKKHKIKWNLGNNDINRDMPDFRRIAYSRQASNPNAPFAAQIAQTVQPEQAGRFFSSLYERMRSASLDYQIQLHTDGAKNTAQLKTGIYIQSRNRTFESRTFGYIFRPGPGVPQSIRNYGLDSIFDPRNFIFVNSRYFMVDESTLPSDRYSASSVVNAGYVMMDQKLFERLRLVYGVRFEQFVQRLRSLGPTSDSVTVNRTNNDFLPSVNLTYSLTEKSNLRLSGSQTVSRPEFREIAPFAFYDFNIDYVVGGNPSLVNTKIANLDLRYEYFLGGAQLISASVFYKDFQNPIETVNDVDGSGAGSRRFGYLNSPHATNYGIEFELRKNFDFLKRFTTKEWINDIFFLGNVALIRSLIDASNFGLASTGDRPLQGQSPFLFNAGLQYFNSNKNYSVSLMGNRVGRRIAFVGNAGLPDIWENPRTVLDFQISKTFKNRLAIKLNVSDILAQKLTFYMDLDNNGKYNDDKDNTIFQYTNGFQTSLSLNYKF